MVDHSGPFWQFCWGHCSCRDLDAHLLCTQKLVLCSSISVSKDSFPASFQLPHMPPFDVDTLCLCNYSQVAAQWSMAEFCQCMIHQCSMLLSHNGPVSMFSKSLSPYTIPRLVISQAPCHVQTRICRPGFLATMLWLRLFYESFTWQRHPYSVSLQSKGISLMMT